MLRIQFWGVRGSVPSCITPNLVQDKISEIIDRIKPQDVESPEAKLVFIQNLPDYLYGTIGGNTACVQIHLDCPSAFIFDLGTGVREYSRFGIKPENNHFNIFISHCHWDHIQGLPFFNEIYNKNCTFDVYSGFDCVEQCFSQQNQEPFFPANARWENIKSRFTFHTVEPDVPFDVEGVKIVAHKMCHPGGSYSYSVEQNGRKVVYATDIELKKEDFETGNPNKQFFKDSDAIILDCQYTPPEAFQKEDWGHSSYSDAVDFTAVWHIKRMYLFHHEPTYDDMKIHQLLQAAKWYASYNSGWKVDINLAIEGQEVEI